MILIVFALAWISSSKYLRKIFSDSERLEPTSMALESTRLISWIDTSTYRKKEHIVALVTCICICIEKANITLTFPLYFNVNQH